MSEWKPSSLAELIEIKHGYAFKGEHFVDYPTENVLVTPGNFAIGGGFKSDKLKYYDGPVPEGYILRPGDLIVTMTDLSKQADTLGYSAVVPRLGFQLLHNQRIGLVTSRDKTLGLDFLGWLMRTPAYRACIVGSATGSTVKHTSPSRIKEFEFLLPPLEDRCAISALLNGLDDKIELNRRMSETLEAQARALFRDWFVDFGPVKAKMAGEAPYLAPDLWSLFPDRFDDGGVPEGWSYSTIGAETEAVGGSTPSTKNPAFWDGDIAWTSPKDLSGLNSPVLLETARSITPAGLEKISSGLLPPGTVLLSSRAPVGYLAISQIPLAVNQGYIAMKCGGRVSNWFAYLWAKENLDLILQTANGSTFQEISKKNFRPLPVIVAIEEAHREFDKTVEPLFVKMASNEKENRTLAQTRDMLLPKLMSGAIRVSEAERLAEELV